MDDEALGQILVRHRAGEWLSPTSTTYTDEAALQALLCENPAIVPGVGQDAVAADEVIVSPDSRIDLVVVEPGGEITLVECKLASNSEIRRKVIGQIATYAATVWSMSYQDFDAHLAVRLGRPVVEALEDLVPDGAWDPEEFRTTVGTHLKEGRFRLVIAVDRITAELRRTVEFLNVHTTDQVEILALELGYVRSESVEILVPRTHGTESARLKQVSSTRRSLWKVEEVWAALQKACSDDVIRGVKLLAEDVMGRGGKLQPYNAKHPSMSGYCDFHDTGRALWSVAVYPDEPSSSTLRLNVDSWAKSLGQERVDEILLTLETNAELQRVAAAARSKPDRRAAPALPLGALNTDVARTIIQALDQDLPERHPVEASSGGVSDG